MLDDAILEIQRLYPQIYLACHVQHVRSASTKWRLSSSDSSILAHLDLERPTSPRVLARHLGVSPSTLSAALSRLVDLGYLTSQVSQKDKRRRQLRLTCLGSEAIAATSVLDAERVGLVLRQLTAPERQLALKGMRLLAEAARSKSLSQK